jgi:hypothetical protein
MPVFFFLGRRDRWVSPETSVAYFNMLTAPSKMLVWFEESGHEPFVDEADKFNGIDGRPGTTGRWLVVEDGQCPENRLPTSRPLLQMPSLSSTGLSAP